MVRPTKVRIQPVSYFQLSDRSLSNLPALWAIDRKCPVEKCYRNSHLQRPVMRNHLEGPVFRIIGSARCIKVCDIDYPAGEWGPGRKYLGRREIGPALPQLTLRSQRRFPDCQLSNFPLRYPGTSGRSPGHLPGPPLIPSVTYPGSSSAKPYCSKSGPPHKLPLYGVTSR
jgi:hypothetical protein